MVNQYNFSTGSVQQPPFFTPYTAYQGTNPGRSPYSNFYSTYHPAPSAPLLYLVTKANHAETEKLIAKASALSDAILYPKASTSSSASSSTTQSSKRKNSETPSVNFDFSDRSFRMFNNEQHVHHHHHEEKENKDDTGFRILVGIVGLVVTGIAAFCIGKAMAEGEDAEEEDVSFEKLKNQWNTNKVCYEPDYQTTLDEVINRADALSQRAQANRTHKVALLIVSFIAGGTAVVGAVIGSKVVIVIAAGIGTSVALVSLYKLGYALFSKRDEKDAKAIEEGIAELRKKDVVVI